MPRYIAIYKGYNEFTGLQQGKDYQIVSRKNDKDQLIITILDQPTVHEPFIYSTNWEFLKDWQIIRTWSGQTR